MFLSVWLATSPPSERASLMHTYKVGILNSLHEKGVKRTPTQPLKSTGSHARTKIAPSNHIPDGSGEDEHG